MARDWEGEVRALIERLAAAEGLPMDALAGATDEQIDALARIQGLTTLPAPYVAFLRLVGGDVTDPYLFMGESIVVPHLIDSGGPSCRVERAAPAGPRFFGMRPVFLDHEGWDFLYLVENRDDSPIAQTGEGATGEGPVVARDFVDWLTRHTRSVEHNARNRPLVDPRLDAVLPADMSTWEGAEPLMKVQFEMLEEQTPGATGMDWEAFAAKTAAMFDQLTPMVEASHLRSLERLQRVADQARTATERVITARSPSGRESLVPFEEIIREALEDVGDDGGDPDFDAMAIAASRAALDCVRAGRDPWETNYRIWTAVSRAHLD